MVHEPESEHHEFSKHTVATAGAAVGGGTGASVGGITGVTGASVGGIGKEVGAFVGGGTGASVGAISAFSALYPGSAAQVANSESKA